MKISFHEIDWDSIIQDANEDDLHWLRLKVDRKLGNLKIMRKTIIRKEE